MAEGLSLRVKEYNPIFDLPVGSMALIQSQPRTFEVIEDGLGMYVFNGWNKGMAYLPSGMYVNRGPLDVVSPNGREIITLQQVTDYDSFLLAGDASPVWCISTTEVVGVLLGK